MKSPFREKSGDQRPIRYAVVGLGYIAQASVLPAFKHAKSNSTLTALVSNDRTKLNELGRKYKVEHLYSYDRFENCLESGQIDAVFICLPNTMHHEFTLRAAEAGVHVLCEKPMAVKVGECEEMIEVARRRRVKLMIAYRLHFEPANLFAIETVQSGKLGNLRIFSSTFTMQVKSDNIRVESALGGGPLPDIGIYCINAARYLFRSEPTEVIAVAASTRDPRFADVDEMVSVIMRFPGERLAQFTCSFGAADTSSYTLIGTQGSLCLEQAYEHQSGMQAYLQIGDKKSSRSFRKVDQFAAELLHFSECIQTNHKPRVPGEEGLADVRILRAINRALETGGAIQIARREAPPVRPAPDDEIARRANGRQRLVHAEAPSRE